MKTEEFALDPDLCHLNHAAIGPWPLRTVRAVEAFARENGALGSLRYPAWLEVEQRLRERLARLVGADSADEIALVKSTSEGLSVIAQGLTWSPGDNVVGIAQEFPSNRIVWESLAERGVEWRALDLEHCGEDPETALLACCDARTRLVALSWVQYGRGLRLDLERLGAGCRARGILLCVDAIQGLGALPFDLARCGADFVVADGHKWMLGPEGVALLYVAPAQRERLQLHEFGWRMVADPGNFETRQWQPAPNARRFECGSPNLLGMHALEASLSLIEELGPVSIEAAIAERIEHLIAWIDRQGFELLSPRDPARRAGILTFRVEGVDHEWLWRALMEQRVLCAARGGGLRFSPHFHTTQDSLDAAMKRLMETLSRHAHQ